MGNKSCKQKKIEYRRKVYILNFEGGKVKVRQEHTAPGQRMICGIFDIANNHWQNDDSIPNHLKMEIEKEFS